MAPTRTLLLGFVAGFLAVLTFHQATIWLMGQAGLLPAGGAWNMSPVPPFGVPRVLSLAFWGGVWGMVMGAILLARPRASPIAVGLFVGAVLCVLAGFTIVAALRGQPMWGGGDIQRWWRSILINGIYGIGAGIFLRALLQRR